MPVSIDLTVQLVVAAGSSLTLLFGGVWFSATQAAALKNLSSRIDEIKTGAAERYRTHDTEISQRDKAISAVDNRLTRIEAQLDFLIASKTTHPLPGE